MELEIADIATNERKKLNGFKILGVFPFYLRYITVATHIQLCKIKEQIQAISPKELTVSDFENFELQKNITPLILEYCATALSNNRPFSFMYKFFIMQKLKKSGHYHILNLYYTIFKLNEPVFFLTYWKLINQKDHTLLKEAKQS